MIRIIEHNTIKPNQNLAIIDLDFLTKTRNGCIVILEARHCFAAR